MLLRSETLCLHPLISNPAMQQSRAIQQSSNRRGPFFHKNEGGKTGHAGFSTGKPCMSRFPAPLKNGALARRTDILHLI
jgi:hypothetical protein